MFNIDDKMTRVHNKKYEFTLSTPQNIR